jgi:hypothetical protein
VDRILPCSCCVLPWFLAKNINKTIAFFKIQNLYRKQEGRQYQKNKAILSIVLRIKTVKLTEFQFVKFVWSRKACKIAEEKIPKGKSNTKKMATKTEQK